MTEALKELSRQFEKVVKVILHKAASSSQTDGSVVFARFCHEGTLAPSGE